MSIETEEDRDGLERAGKVTRAVLETMKAAVQPGISTAKLDAVGAAVIRAEGARSAPQKVYGFPGHNCISVNDEVVHGVPGRRRLAAGDLLKLDVTVEVGGYMADACETVVVGEPNEKQAALVTCAERAFGAGLAVVRPGICAYEVGAAIEREVRDAGFSVVRELMGHGIGRTIHEAPSIPNYREPRCGDVLTEGLVFTIEPILVQGSGQTVMKRDGWTMRTRDRSLAAHYEHTVVVTRDGARLLTA